jgi:hypothetical protein
VNDKPFACGCCAFRSLSQKGLNNHAYTRHRGTLRAVWQPGYVPAKSGPAPKPTRERPVGGDEAERRDREYARMLKPQRPLTDAEKLTGLPWMALPRTQSEAALLGKHLDAIVQSLTTPTAVKAIVANWRAFIVALADRLPEALPEAA